MSHYDYSKLTKSIVERTKSNILIDFPYEVTQLINSLFGLIVFPFERYKYSHKLGFGDDYLKGLNEYRILKDKINRLNSDNYYNSYETSNDSLVIDFVKHIKNALSHAGNGRLFFPCESEEITSIIFYDEYKKRKQFCLELTVEEVKSFAYYISNLFVALKYNDNSQLYTKDVEGKRLLFKK